MDAIEIQHIYTETKKWRKERPVKVIEKAEP